jgi:sRNA-binding carbon storage regulator CsrA
LGQQFAAAIGVRAPKQVAILHRFKLVRQFASEKSLNSERKQLLGLEKKCPVEYASGSDSIKRRQR